MKRKSERRKSRGSNEETKRKELTRSEVEWEKLKRSGTKMATKRKNENQQKKATPKNYEAQKCDVGGKGRRNTNRLQEQAKILKQRF